MTKPSTRKRIALFGGSFNPPHISHVLDVAFLLACVELDEVRVVPTFDHAFGKALEPFEHRMEMVRRAMACFGARVVVDDLERRLGGESRTIRLVDRLLAEDPERQLVLVIGSDLLQELERWMESKRLLSIVELCVLRRTGFPSDDPRLMGPEIPEVSSTELRGKLDVGDFDGCRGLLPREVLEYIRAHGLYA